ALSTSWVTPYNHFAWLLGLSAQKCWSAYGASQLSSALLIKSKRSRQQRDGRVYGSYKTSSFGIFVYQSPSG
ncbi:MAG TPA: hypothetical protein VF918_15340, partial [Anaerolineales bacterium]